MQYLSQKDPRWANVRIGRSATTVAKNGCTLTDVSMISDFFGSFIDPKTLASHRELFDGQGRMIWGNLVAIFHAFRFVWRQYGENDQKIQASLTPPLKAVILEVWNKKHWLLGVRQVSTSRGIDYLCIDPLNARQCFAKATYGNVTGSAHFEKT